MSAALAVVQEGLRALESGLSMHAYAGTGHLDSEIIAAVRDSELDDLNGCHLLVSEGRWGWSPRMKHCSNYDSGWGCDDEGDWHRHYSPGYGDQRVTVVTVYAPSWNPAPYRDSRVVHVEASP